MKKKKILLKKFAFDCWHNTSTVIHNKQYTTQQTIHNTKYIVVI